MQFVAHFETNATFKLQQYFLPLLKLYFLGICGIELAFGLANIQTDCKNALLCEPEITKNKKK